VHRADIRVEYRILQVLQGKTPSPEMWLVQGFHGFSDLSSEREHLIRQMQGLMTGTQGVNNDLYGASPVRFRLYFSGMSVAALLDRLGAKWHDAIFKPDVTLTGLARTAIHATPQELDAALASMKATSRYSGLVAEKNAFAKAGVDYVASEAAKFDSAPVELVIDYSKLDQPKVAFGLTPFGILRVDADRTIYRLIPIRGKIGSASFSEDGPRPVLQDKKVKAVLLQLTGAPDLKSISDQIKTPIWQPFEASELHLPGVDLKKIKGRITLQGTKLTIQLLELGPTSGTGHG